MANRIARYKDQQTLDIVQLWWESKPFQYYTVDSLFIDYTESCLNSWGNEYVMSQREFEQCIFKLGIRDIATPPANPIFSQADNYRPADSLVERYQR